MKLPAWHEEPIAKHHDRQAFDCGEETLNSFLRRHARQSHEAGGAKTFLAIPNAGAKTILGFYSLSPASLEYARTPASVKKNLARHKAPVFRLARLATALPLQGQGLGGQLLLAAGRRCLRVAAEVGGVALLIYAKNARAAAWYASYGALSLTNAPHTLVVPLETLSAALKAADGTA